MKNCKTNKLVFLLVSVLIFSAFYLPGSVFANTEKKISYNTLGSSIFYGDLNGDENVDTMDYVLLQRYALGVINKFPVGNTKAADLNGDDEINSLDATLMSKYILGVIKEFPVSTGAVYASIDTSTRHQVIEGFGGIHCLLSKLAYRPSK